MLVVKIREISTEVNWRIYSCILNVQGLFLGFFGSVFWDYLCYVCNLIRKNGIQVEVSTVIERIDLCTGTTCMAELWLRFLVNNTYVQHSERLLFYIANYVTYTIPYSLVQAAPLRARVSHVWFAAFQWWRARTCTCILLLQMCALWRR